jgi:O-antigen/teichoic acid export membrane protein
MSTNSSPSNRIDLPSLKTTGVFNGSIALINLIVPLLILVYATRTLGPSSWGIYASANSLASYFLLAASSGLPLYGIREIAKLRGNSHKIVQLVQSLALLNLAAATVFTVFYYAFLFVNPFKSDPANSTAILLGLLIPLNAFNLEFVFYGLERPGLIAIRTLLGKSISFGLVLAFVRKPGDQAALAAALGVGVLVQICLSLVSLLNAFPLRATYRPGGWRKHIQPIGMLFPILALTFVYTALDTYLAGHYLNNTDLGYFNASTRMIRTFATLAGSIGIAILPRMAWLQRNSKSKEGEALLKQFLTWILLLHIPAMLIVCIKASWLIQITYGLQYHAAYRGLQLASPMLLFSAVGGFISIQILFPEDKIKTLIVAAGLGAGSLLIMLWLFTPTYGVLGAVGACTGSEFCVLIAMTLGAGLKRVLRILTNSFWKIGLATFTMSIPLLIIHSDGIGEGSIMESFSIVISVVTYIITLWFLGERLTRVVLCGVFSFLSRTLPA